MGRRTVGPTYQIHGRPLIFENLNTRPNYARMQRKQISGKHLTVTIYSPDPLDFHGSAIKSSLRSGKYGRYCTLPLVHLHLTLAFSATEAFG